MSTSVSGFWNGRVLALNWADDTGMLDITAFYPNPRTPSTAAARIASTERLMGVFENKDRPHLVIMSDGRRFNISREGAYLYDEVTIRQGDGGVKYLDSYTPGEAVVSRKITQLAEVSDDRVRDIVDEFDKKYRPGDQTSPSQIPPRIASSLHNRRNSSVNRSMVRGSSRFPVQSAEVPAWARQYAADRDILIRDATGVELNREELDGW